MYSKLTNTFNISYSQNSLLFLNKRFSSINILIANILLFFIFIWNPAAGVEQNNIYDKSCNKLQEIGDAFIEIGKYQEGIQAYDKAIEHNYHDSYSSEIIDSESTCPANVFIKKGDVFFKIGMYSEGIQAYDKAVELSGNIYHAGRLYPEGTKYYDNTFEQQYYEKIQERNKLLYSLALLSKGVALFKMGMYQQAIEPLDAYLKINPNDIRVLGFKGLSLFNMGLYQQAIENYVAALKINPNDISILGLIAVALFDNGMHQQAIEYADAALKIDPQNVPILNFKGSALVKMGMYQQAIEPFNAALKVNPKDDVALNNKGLAILKMGMYQQAIEYFNAALKIDPNDIRTLNNKGLALYNLESYQQAIEYFNAALKIDPNFVDALNNKGLALTKLGKYDEAIDYYKKALSISGYTKPINYYTKIQPIYPIHSDLTDSWISQTSAITSEKVESSNPQDILVNVALNYIQQGKYDEAIDMCDSALKLQPNFQDALIYKAIALKKLGNAKEADEIFQKTGNNHDTQPDGVQLSSLRDPGVLESISITITSSLFK